jgi:DNA-binding XRE family transcriptional regulator
MAISASTVNASNAMTGALSKSVSRGRVAPYLLGMEPHELRPPLAQFQATRGDKDGTWALVNAINTAAPEPLAETDLSDAFQAHWPLLSSVLNTLVEAGGAQGITSPQSSESAPLKTSSPVEKQAATVRKSPKVIRRRIARNIRALRVAAGLTQDNLAIKAGVAAHYVERVEDGVVNLSIDSLVSIARALRVAPGDLM